MLISLLLLAAYCGGAPLKKAECERKNGHAQRALEVIEEHLLNDVNALTRHYAGHGLAGAGIAA